MNTAGQSFQDVHHLCPVVGWIPSGSSQLYTVGCLLLGCLSYPSRGVDGYQQKSTTTFHFSWCTPDCSALEDDRSAGFELQWDEIQTASALIQVLLSQVWRVQIQLCLVLKEIYQIHFTTNCRPHEKTHLFCNIRLPSVCAHNLSVTKLKCGGFGGNCCLTENQSFIVCSLSGPEERLWRLKGNVRRHPEVHGSVATCSVHLDFERIDYKNQQESWIL